MDDDLSLVETDAMLAELQRRFNSMVFAGCGDHINAGEADCREFREWHANGDLIKCVGLAHWLATNTVLKINEQSHECPE